MSQNFIDIFKAACIKLAKSVVINHPYAGMVINRRLAIQNFGKYTNDLDRTTWKYYLNMAGIYHAYDSVAIYKINNLKNLGLTPGIDRSKMIIRVAGDEGTVEKEFTLENISGINSDENLSFDYQENASAYNELLDTYPEFEMLIKGILHPINLTTSTNADDFSVLYCGGYYRTRLDGLKSEYAFIKGTSLIYDYIDLVEGWEYGLIEEIEKFTKIFFRQHDSRIYSNYNDLYYASSLGIYALNLPSLIFNLRFEKVKTLETHSTHAQLYLDSYSGIGQYMNYMTRTQYMYLYQNIEWLACNSGKQKVFDELVENFLKPRGIAVIVYNGYHNLARLGINDDPEPVFIRDYNDGTKLINTKKTYTAADIIDLEKDCARDNTKYVNDQVQRVIDTTLNSTSAKFKTKIIETHLSTQTLNQYVSREEFLFNNWVWSAVAKEYTGIISVNLPNSGNKIQLTIKNALLLFYYCYAKGFLNITPTEIPLLLLHHIPKIKSEVDEVAMRKRVSSKYVTEDDFINLFSRSPDTREYRSTGSFGRRMKEMWENFIARNYVAHNNSFIRASGEIKGLVDQLYHVKKLKIDIDPAYPSYENWVSSLGNGIQNMDQHSLQVLATSLFVTSLSIEGEDEETLIRIHKALINVVKIFSSYNIQFITKTASGEVSNLGVNYLRAENVLTRYSDDSDFHICNYPDYQSPIQSSAKTDTRWGFGMVYDTHGDAILLSQEQLKGLITSENNEPLIL